MLNIFCVSVFFFVFFVVFLNFLNGSKSSDFELNPSGNTGLE